MHLVTAETLPFSHRVMNHGFAHGLVTDETERRALRDQFETAPLCSGMLRSVLDMAIETVFIRDRGMR